MKRNPILTTAWAKTLDYDRLQSSETVRLKDFFEVLDELKGQISSVRQIYNMDETSFATGTTEYKIKVFTTRGKQRANRISAAKGKHCTLVVASCGDGSFLPPSFIFAGVHELTGMRDGAPQDSELFMSRTGWIDGEGAGSCGSSPRLQVLC